MKATTTKKQSICHRKEEEQFVYDKERVFLVGLIQRNSNAELQVLAQNNSRTLRRQRLSDLIKHIMAVNTDWLMWGYNCC